MAKRRKYPKGLNSYQKQRIGFKEWTAFYRVNPHAFAKDYLGMNLHLYQVILLWAMNEYNFFMYLASRGQGKSFITAVYCVIRAILYPNSNIVLASGTYLVPSLDRNTRP